ncbi:MAG: zf-HC2 domain-containing protein [Armatimonadetes bacterium]|nr:zf-HC2 domain-containing protein [Armatimonadota bacterium]
MVCSRVGNLISAYLDQELTGTEALAIRYHLVRCPECQANYQALRRVKELYQALPMVEPQPGAVWWRATAASRPVPWWRLRLAGRSLRGLRIAGVGLASACTAVAVVLLILGQPGEPDAVVARTRPAIMAMLDEDVPPPPAETWSGLTAGLATGWPPRDLQGPVVAPWPARWIHLTSD